MNKSVILLVLALFAVLLVSITTAGAIVCQQEATTIGGTIYQGDVTNGISGAAVEVICAHNGTDYTETTTSLSNGEYSVMFAEGECDYGDSVTVNADKDSLTGENIGSVTMTYDLCCLTLNVGIVNVPLVPEFGLIAGSVAMIGALGLFFFVRRK